jgi:hypothetical protein
MLATSAEGAFAIDGEGRIVLWNQAEDRLGHTAREAVPPGCDLLMGDDENGNRLCCRGCHIMQPPRIRTLSTPSTCERARRAGRPSA